MDGVTVDTVDTVDSVHFYDHGVMERHSGEGSRLRQSLVLDPEPDFGLKAQNWLLK